jgi:hypothetical protein
MQISAVPLVLRTSGPPSAIAAAPRNSMRTARRQLAETLVMTLFQQPLLARAQAAFFPPFCIALLT